MSDSYIVTLNAVIVKLTFYVPYFTITLGTLGGLCNILTFTAKQLRHNSCAFYFLCSAVFDLLTLLFCAVMRLLVDHYDYVLPQNSPGFCKMRTYLTGVFPALSTCCVMLASIDRCLLTSGSARWRNWSTMKIAYRLVPISIIFWLLSPAHMLVFYDYYTINGVPSTCASRPGTYATFASIFFIVWLTFIPYMIMFTASIITVIHIRKSRHRILPQQQKQQELRRRVERHLMFMMFTQVILSMICLSMRTVVLGYQLLTRDVPKDSRRRAAESFISQFGIILYYVNYAKSFYLYTLTSPFFREIFLKKVSDFWNYIYQPSDELSATNNSAVATTKKLRYENALPKKF